MSPADHSSMLAQGLGCGFLLALVIITAIACEWEKFRAWWSSIKRDVFGPLP